VAEVLEDLIERGLEERRWQRSVAYGQARAKALGLIESDVHGLIADVRLERRQEQARD
jgi:hypothetical protein